MLVNEMPSTPAPLNRPRPFADVISPRTSVPRANTVVPRTTIGYASEPVKPAPGSLCSADKDWFVTAVMRVPTGTTSAATGAGARCTGAEVAEDVDVDVEAGVLAAIAAGVGAAAAGWPMALFALVAGTTYVPAGSEPAETGAGKGEFAGLFTGTTSVSDGNEPAVTGALLLGAAAMFAPGAGTGAACLLHPAISSAATHVAPNSGIETRREWMIFKVNLQRLFVINVPICHATTVTCL